MPESRDNQINLFCKHINVSRETFEKLIVYEQAIIKWNKKINLIADSTCNTIWLRHFLDSAQIIKFINSECSIIDIGSGAGFPGIVLSILGVRKVTLVEKVGKKAVFLRYISSLLGLKVEVLSDRVENLKIKDSFDVLTCRAFATVPSILNISKSIKYNYAMLIKSNESLKDELCKISKNDFEIIRYFTETDSVLLKIQTKQ